VIDQARKDGFQFRNIDDTYHPSTNISSEEDPRVSGVPELREKEGFEELEKDEHLMLDCAPGGTLVDFIPISQMVLFLSKKKRLSICVRRRDYTADVREPAIRSITTRI